MSKTTTPTGVDFSGVAKTIVPVDLQDEIESSFLPYAYAVIGGRALPDAEDGLKPVQRRILYSMLESGYTPEKNHVKSARIVGNVMGSYHPHGDSSLYDAMVRMAQPYVMRVPLVDGHGNFGSGPGDTAAASRYTEARLSKEALALLAEVRENCVDVRPNYDSTLTEPVLLPAQFPNLLVNGVSGIAVGFATKMPTHNPGEVIAAARAQLADPDITLDELIGHLPGPDLPTGAQIIGIDGIRDAYESGRGTFKVRSRYQVEPVGRGRHRLIFTELPYEVQIEKVIEAIKKAMSEGRLLGIEDVKDLSDRISGTRFVVETKAGINPEALATELFTRTDLEINFNVNNTVLVAGQVQVLGLKGLLQVFLDHRTATVTRRTQHRLDKRAARLHLVSGLLKALADIDKVIALVRAAENAATARTDLIEAMGVDEVQADHILALQLRRLTRLDALELDAEADRLRCEIEELSAILADPQVLRATIDTELEQVAAVLERPRRSEIVGVSLDEHLAQVKEAKKAATVEVADEPTTVSVLASGALLRGTKAGRKVDPVIASLETTTRSRIVAVTDQGRGLRIDALHVALDVTSTPAQAGIHLQPGERIIALAPGEVGTGHGLALATAGGIVKITQPTWPVRSDEFSLIALDEGDRVVAGSWLPSPEADLVLVSSDTSLLRFEAAKVRPQGLSGGGVAGIKLAEGARVLAFAAVAHERADEAVVITWSADSIKVSPYASYPAKGRATGGVRSMKLLKGVEGLQGAWVGTSPAAATAEGGRYELPALDTRRDGSGQRCQTFPALVGG